MRVQPRVNAIRVVQVQARRQQPHRVSELQRAEANRARRRLLPSARHVVLHRQAVRERREAGRRAGGAGLVKLPHVDAHAATLPPRQVLRRSRRRTGAAVAVPPAEAAQGNAYEQAGDEAAEDAGNGPALRRIA